MSLLKKDAQSRERPALPLCFQNAKSGSGKSEGSSLCVKTGRFTQIFGKVFGRDDLRNGLLILN